MPFIGLVLEQVAPYMDRMLVTVSSKSSDETLGVIKEVQLRYPKIEVAFERTMSPEKLTKERQKMLDKTTEDWVLFLDDDDYWPSKSLESIISILGEDVDAYAVNPVQVVDKYFQDFNWRTKFFTKFFKNQEGVHYRKPWPRDQIYKNDEWLFWKKNTRVRKLGYRFIHLSNLKNHSFRDEAWAKKFKATMPNPRPIPEVFEEDIKKIYEYK